MHKKSLIFRSELSNNRVLLVKDYNHRDDFWALPKHTVGRAFLISRASESLVNLFL